VILLRERIMRQAELLHQQSEFLKTTVESFPYPFYVVDAEDYTIKIANKIANPQGLTDPPTCYTLIHKNPKPCGETEHSCPLEEVKKTKKPVVVEHIHYDIDGNAKNTEVRGYPIFDHEGNVIQMIEFSLDISERKRAEEEIRTLNEEMENRLMEYITRFEAANKTLLTEFRKRKLSEEMLQKSEERYRSIVETANEGIGVIDANRRIIFVNKKMVDMLGYTMEEILGKDVFSFISEEDKLIGEEKFDQDKGVMKNLELKFRQKNGNFLWVLASGAPVFDSQGQYAGTMTMFMDITARKQAEDELKSSYEQIYALAVHLQSVAEEERTRIARDIHDEFGQRLTALKFDLSWLRSKISKIGGAAGGIIEKINSMLELTDSTIQWARRISTGLRPSVLDDLGIVSALQWLSEEFQNKTGIVCKFTSSGEDLNLVREKSTAVFRICQECLTNVARHAGASAVTVRLRKEENNIILEINDNGRGIGENEIANPKSFGLLGMRERAVILDGEINFKGIPKEGTTVMVKIPLDKPRLGNRIEGMM
ncbi:MAG TPA: hypothetical protein DHV62_03385, partial [Elusimicrobia bacterium]|nr:hypothetical protein [Elusimicrobiota bacterium]